MIEAFENDRGFIKRTLTYGDAEEWSDMDMAGEPIAREDVTAVYFNVRDKETDNETIIALSDADADEIEWLDEDNGIILIKLGEQTDSHIGVKYYDLRVQFADDSWLTLEYGRINIRNLANLPS